MARIRKLIGKKHKKHHKMKKHHKKRPSKKERAILLKYTK